VKKTDFFFLGKETSSDSGSTVVSVALPSTSSPVVGFLFYSGYHLKKNGEFHLVFWMLCLQREKFRVSKKVDPENSFRHQRKMIQVNFIFFSLNFVMCHSFTE